MNTPAPTTDDAMRPSASIDEALERLVAAHNRRIYELEKQRDELAACVREAKDGFVSGRFLCPACYSADELCGFTEFLTRCNVALMRSSVRERLDDCVAAERRGQEAAP